MLRRKDFKQPQELFFNIRDRIKLYTEQRPERVIAIMFLILLLSVIGLLIRNAVRSKGYQSSITSIYKELDRKNPPRLKPHRPLTSEMLSLMNIWSKASSIDPNSLTEKDTLLLKEIDKDLNRMWHEKN